MSSTSKIFQHQRLQIIINIKSTSTCHQHHFRQIFTSWGTNETEVILEIEPEVAFKCEINYQSFPFHKATCKFQITSFNEVNNSMLFITDRKHGDPGQHLEAVRGYSVRVSYLTGDETTMESRNEANHFSIVGLKIDLVSTYMKYIYVYFIPTSMFTFTSWVSFLLPPTSYPARTSLLVTVNKMSPLCTCCPALK